MRRVLARMVAGAAAVVMWVGMGFQTHPAPRLPEARRGVVMDVPGPTAVEEGDPPPASAMPRVGTLKPVPPPRLALIERTRSSRPPMSVPQPTRPPRAAPHPSRTDKPSPVARSSPSTGAGAAEAGRPAESVGPGVMPPAAPAPPAGPTGEPASEPGAAAPPAAAVQLTPPVPIDQPPLHPLMKAVVTSGPVGVAGLEELSVRGRLRVRLLIRADGTVGRVDILVSSGDGALDHLASDGLLRWRFVPASRDGIPIDAYLSFWVSFRD